MLTFKTALWSLLPAVCSTLALNPSHELSWGQYEQVESVQTIPHGWKFREQASDTTILNLQLVVQSINPDSLASRLLQIGTPGSEDYGKHLSQQQLSNLVAPEPASVDALTSWLDSFDGVSISGFTAETSSIVFTSTVEIANAIFDANFGVYEAGGETVVRSLQYGLPAYIRPKTALVHPMTHFPRPKSTRSKIRTTPQREVEKFSRRDALDDIPSNCLDGIYPSCIAQLYNIDYTPPTNSSPSGSSLGIAGFLGEYINRTDVDYFVRKYGNAESTRSNPGSFTIELVNGGINDESTHGTEATLDMEYSMPFTGSLPVVYYSVGGRGEMLDQYGKAKPLNESVNEPYLEWLEYMLAKPDGEIPQVLSISYTDTEQTVPRAYALHVCDLFGRLAARGVSILDASGDGGVAGVNTVPCISNDGQNRTTFLPTFPASCPWVTAVGSTSYFPQEGSDFSSGGFSNYFAVPDYQVNSTSSYKTFLNGKYDGLYNASGRGIPDIAVFGARYETETRNSSAGHHSGTSAGTAVFASMVALINDLRLRDGKPVLGWLNPMIYSKEMKSVWTDIQKGYSYGCGQTWNTSVGWDTVTGLGTPDFKKMVEALV